MHKALKRTGSVVGAALLALVATTAAAGVAEASYDSCPYGKVCLFTGADGSGSRWVAPDCGMEALPSGIANRAVSARTYGNSIDMYYSTVVPSLVYVESVGQFYTKNLQHPGQADTIFVNC
ncbi:peptidase inhibitor family I36 protein [Amycolatopsis sp. OK19-0408]|uniref:Peptidase inhibitor family I36 protein n=1 Tax=Amycolatopsis iheyensis TaxID=2945988 RepID=A0A9X2NPB3_9PSEU|nr:peptidase inhibitor family I36 protein [Amycolatopsis iheyensis]MCR6490609.1 peptidase inhibitor family I36 protein [Amycolatopsis iheyensis]